MTEKLYYQDSYLSEFEAEVLSCVPKGNKYEVVLSRTAFFPEGGGQTADTGVLVSGQQRIQVL
ncbi:MAG: alanine--tRNA ligase-related protein, partial [Blautia sp.]